MRAGQRTALMNIAPKCVRERARTQRPYATHKVRVHIGANKSNTGPHKRPLSRSSATTTSSNSSLGNSWGNTMLQGLAARAWVRVKI